VRARKREREIDFRNARACGQTGVFERERERESEKEGEREREKERERKRECVREREILQMLEPVSPENRAKSGKVHKYA